MFPMSGNKPIINPGSIIRNIAVREIPKRGVTFTPQPTTQNPNPTPRVIVEDSRILPDFSDLADEVINQFVDKNGQPILGNIVSVMWAMLNSMEIRYITGQIVVTDDVLPSPWSPGVEVEFSIVWNFPLPEKTGDVLVTIEAGVAKMGRTSAWVKPGSITPSGCIIVARNVSALPILTGIGQPITYTAQAAYIYTPPISEVISNGRTTA
jgi:hypothetical protein